VKIQVTKSTPATNSDINIDWQQADRIDFYDTVRQQDLSKPHKGAPLCIAKRVMCISDTITFYGLIKKDGIGQSFRVISWRGNKAMFAGTICTSGGDINMHPLEFHKGCAIGIEVKIPNKK